MREAKWFLLWLVMCPLVWGSAWAHVTGFDVATHPTAQHAANRHAHCPDAPGADTRHAMTDHELARTAEDPVSTSCCQTTHCQLCGLVGLLPVTGGEMAMLPAVLPPTRATTLWRWQQVPELRPPI